MLTRRLRAVVLPAGPSWTCPIRRSSRCRSQLSRSTVAKTRTRVASVASDSGEGSAPTRPVSGFSLFAAECIAEERKKGRNIKDHDLMRSVAAQWNKLWEMYKKPYNLRAARLKDEIDYDANELKTVRAVRADKRQRAMTATKAKSDRDRRLVEIDTGRPTLLTASSYMLFEEDMMAELSVAEGKRPVDDSLPEQWRDLPDTLKASYEARAAENAARNRQTLDAWRQEVAPSSDNGQEVPPPAS